MGVKIEQYSRAVSGDLGSDAKIGGERGFADAAFLTGKNDDLKPLLKNRLSSNHAITKARET